MLKCISSSLYNLQRRLHMAVKYQVHLYLWKVTCQKVLSKNTILHVYMYTPQIKRNLQAWFYRRKSVFPWILHFQRIVSKFFCPNQLETRQYLFGHLRRLKIASLPLDTSYVKMPRLYLRTELNKGSILQTIIPIANVRPYSFGGNSFSNFSTRLCLMWCSYNCKHWIILYLFWMPVSSRSTQIQRHYFWRTC